MTEKLATLWPEIILFTCACVVMLLGLSERLGVRQLCAPVSAAGLLLAGLVAFYKTPVDPAAMLPNLPVFGKVLAAGIGLLILGLLTGIPDRDYEARVAQGRTRFDPKRTIRSEFYAFFLFSITGLMLCAGATNLIWLFLALELTSLPTYVMVALSTQRDKSLEAAVKYFFLGAMAAAVFLFGFVLLYGATGSVELAQIGATLRHQASVEGGINPIALAGLVLGILGLCFKIAAVPMHFYTPDVYQGAASPVAGMLAFVPKAAGFFALMLLLTAPGWGWMQPGGPGGGHGALPTPIGETLAIIAVASMTLGNVLAIMQTSVKRLLAYSSIAHSGYMLVALLAGPGRPGTLLPENGYSAILFYLLSYGLTSTAAFAVLALLERKGPDGQVHEADNFADIRGLRKKHPALAWVLALSALGLMGFPPLLGFFAKLPLFASGLAGGHLVLVVILGLNSAVAAFYYLRIVSAALLESPDAPGHAESMVQTPFRGRALAGYVGVLAMLAMVVLPLLSAGSFLHVSPASWASFGGTYKGVAPLAIEPRLPSPATPMGAAPTGEGPMSEDAPARP